MFDSVQQGAVVQGRFAGEGQPGEAFKERL
jgi:hypothetical protein